MKKKHGLLFIVLGTLLVLVAAVIAAVLTYFTFRLFFMIAHPDGIYAAMLTSSYAVIFLFVVIFEILFLTFNVKPETRDPKLAQPMLGRQNQLNTVKQTITKKGILTVRLICAAVSVVILLAVSNVYTLYSDKGITKSYAVVTKNYEWKNVRSYSVSFEDVGGFVFTLNMKDNSSYTLASTFHDSTKQFKEKFDDIYDYAVFVDSRLEELQVTKRVSDINKFKEYYEQDFPEVWEKIKVIIDYDEVVSE